MPAYTLTGTVEAQTVLGGALVPQLALRNSREERAALLGYRPSFPLIVQSVTVETVGDIVAAQVPNGGNFVVSTAFLGSPGDPLFDAGAKAGSIGTRFDHSTLGTLYVFRPPTDWEVVWHVEINLDGDFLDHGLYRFHLDSWLPYLSMPERGIEGQMAFDVLDPDRIYIYYARLMGTAMTQWQEDNRTLLDFIDPDRCPEAFLKYLAQQVNLQLDSAQDPALQREQIKSAIPTFKAKGTTAAVITMLRSIGYLGYVNDIWVNPDNPANWTDDDTGEKGNDWIEVIHGTRYEEPFIGFRLLGSTQPADGDTVQVSDYTLTKTFEFDSGGGVTPGNVAVTIGATAWATLQNLVTAINGAGLSLTAARDTMNLDEPTLRLSGGMVTSLTRTVGAFNNYWPSSRVVLHVNYLSGEPLDTTRSEVANKALKEMLAEALRRDVLPAWVDIREFVTDVPAAAGGEALEIGDALVLTEV